MAVIKAVSSKAGIGQALDYVTKEEKTEDKLVSGLHCEAETVKEEMAATKELWRKTGGRTYKHFVQSYHAGEQITPEQAHKNAEELARNTEAWKGHEVLIATHIDRGHIHTHFIVNSVNYEDGHKLQWSKADLQDLKDRCNEQSRQQWLHVPEKGKTFSGEEREETVAWNKETYNLLKQAEKGEVKSYVQDIALSVLDCKEQATSREDFIQRMKERGYGVDWRDNHKYITFTDLAREEQGEKQCKVRNNKLEKYYAVDFGKESLEHGFEVNARAKQTTKRAREQLTADRGSGTQNIGAGADNINAQVRGAENEREAERSQRLQQLLERREREAAENARAVSGRTAGSRSTGADDKRARETDFILRATEQLAQRKQREALEAQRAREEAIRREQELKAVRERARKVAEAERSRNQKLDRAGRSYGR